MKVRKISGTNCPTFFYQATHQTIAGNVKLHLGWGSSLRTPKPSTGWCQKSRKNVFSNLQNHPTVLRGGKPSYLRGQVRPNNRSEKHEKMTSEHWNSDVFFTRCYAYQTWFTSCGTREVFIHQRNAGCRSASGPKKSAPKSEKA